MSFLSRILSRSSASEEPSLKPGPAASAVEMAERRPRAEPSMPAAEHDLPERADEAGVSIWDIDPAPGTEGASLEPGADSSTEQLASIMDEVAGKRPRPAARARRNRTRLIGFEHSDGETTDIMRDSRPNGPTERVQFPVGWMLVVDGPGRGHCFALIAGMAQIGRGEDQAIQLDFGDNAISRNNHAAIVYDAEERTFLIGHGGKANVVRLNGKPLISNEQLNDGDLIKIGETTLQLKTLCGPDFDWADGEAGLDDGEHDDVAIA